MNKILSKSIIASMATVAITFATTIPASSQAIAAKQAATVRDTTVWTLPIDNITMKRNSDLMTVGMDMKFGDYKLNGDKVSVFTPMLVNGKDTLAFTPVGLYSRIRYIQYLRDGQTGIGGANELSYKYSQRPAEMDFQQSVPFADWMSGATLYLQRCDYGCCHTLVDQDLVPLGKWYEIAYAPNYHYVTPMAEKVKTRELRGRAFIDFPVNMTNLYPDYRKNPTELLKIIATIDSVKNDEDVTIKEITIKGYASPESPYSNNTRLAKGRTQTLKEYVQNLYRFDERLIKTDFEPEDWEGLREFVVGSGLIHKNEILALIDDKSMDPDYKEALIKKTYPEEYDFLLKTVYPGLRHSDYTIEYTVRHYSDPEEIRKIMAVSPQKLSLDEMFILAQSLEPGSDEYNEVFETAVRMYPNDEVANLNAASAAMQRGDLENAEKYLEKAGDSDAADYTRGVLAAQQGDYRKAASLFAKVADNMPDAAEALDTINKILDLQ